MTQSRRRLRVTLLGTMSGEDRDRHEVAQHDVEHRVDAPDDVLDDDEVEAPDDGDREEQQVGDQHAAAVHGRARDLCRRVHGALPGRSAQSSSVRRKREIAPRPSVRRLASKA